MKILIIRFSSIGDIVLTTPVIRCLKKQVSNAEVHFLTKSQYANIVRSNPYINTVHLLEHGNIKHIIKELKKEKFDYIIDLHRNIRSARIKWNLKKVPSFTFDKLNWRKWLLTTFKINRMPKVHIVDRYLATLNFLKVTNDGQGLDYFIPEREKINEKDIPMSHQLGFVGVVIGATYNTKKLPVDKLKNLCASINYPIVLIGGKEDAVLGDMLAATDMHKIYNSCGKFSINESADLVRRAKLIITHDTGMMHIAAAFKKRIFSIWGNTVPAFGMYPYYGEEFLRHQKDLPYKIFEVRGLSCRPCSKLGYQRCPRQHFKCMNDQNIKKLAEEIHFALF